MDASNLLQQTSAAWLVTGAAGFIGSHLVESLALAGQRVTAVDNFVTGKRENVDAVRRSTDGASGRVEFIEGDICDPDVAGRATDGVDYVLHQAAIGSVPRSIDRPMATFASNVDGFMQVLNAARESKVKTFVYASSSSVYGDHPNLPKREEEVGNVLSPYAATKAANELLAGVFSRCYGMKTVGLRYFNVFGSRQDPEGAYAAVIPKWITSLLRGGPVYVNGDGESSRDFCYIDNVVQANIKAALAGPVEPQGTALNIAVGQRTTLLELFNLLKDLLAAHDPAIRDLLPVFREFRPGDVRHSLASIDKARQSIGYSPTHTLEEGLRVALHWYLANQPSPPA
jgi:UDP-N-acetylglucosamine 4-epimerase